MKFFSTEGGIYKFMTRLWDMIKLNFLWLICSLPIVTIGVSTIAAFTITLKMVEEKEGYIARAFFKAFKANFKQGMVIGPITIVLLQRFIWILHLVNNTLDLLYWVYYRLFCLVSQ